MASAPASQLSSLALRMSWPNQPTWSAGESGAQITTERGEFYIWTISCGSLFLPSGKLVVCDPFAFMRAKDNPHISTPTGSFPVTVTLTDVSSNLDRSHVREAYASIRFADEAEKHRQTLSLAVEDGECPEPGGDEYIGFPVDAGTACFVDASVLRKCMPAESTWLADLFENERSDCWFARMADPGHVRAGIANIPLPLARRRKPDPLPLRLGRRCLSGGWFFQ